MHLGTGHPGDDVSGPPLHSVRHRLLRLAGPDVTVNLTADLTARVRQDEAEFEAAYLALKQERDELRAENERPRRMLEPGDLVDADVVDEASQEKGDPLVSMQPGGLGI